MTGIHYVVKGPMGKARVIVDRKEVRELNAWCDQICRCGQVSGGNWRLEPDANWSTNDDPDFVDSSKGDYGLRGNAPVFKRLAGFKPIPFEKIGLQRKVRQPQ